MVSIICFSLKLMLDVSTKVCYTSKEEIFNAVQRGQEDGRHES